MSKLQKNILLALLIAGAIIISIIESMIPLPFIAPGAKLGLANIIILTVIVIFGFKSAITVSILRCVLLMLIAGNPTSFIYSITSGITCVIVMYMSYKYLNSYFSLIGISVLGSLSHNLSQIAVAAIIMNSLNIFVYLPVMSLISIFTGCFVGYSAGLVTENLNKNIAKFKERGLK